jgi:hypothetical protein
MRFVQPLHGAAADLFSESATLPVIDTHEHIPGSERAYTEQEIRFGQLFNPYVSNDLASAGMSFPPDVWAAFHCIDADWDAFSPYWDAVKFGSYARPIRLALQQFYGVDDLTRENHLEVLAQINARNRPGIYRRILGDACHIEKSIVCAPALPDPDDRLLAGNVSSPSLQVTSRAQIEGISGQVGAEVPDTLEDFLVQAREWMRLQAGLGAIEFKSAALHAEHPDRRTAEDAYTKVLRGVTLEDEETNHLMGVVREDNAATAAELDLPLALHTGVWQDFRRVDVTDTISFLQRNPGTRVDIYHLGIPNVRAAVNIVKNFPNAYLNLCWAHVVASDMVVNTMREALDMVPLNKVFAFGADYVLFIEKVWGHLHMAKENVALVLGDRVDRNLMDMDEARFWFRAWFYDNPKRFYRI